MVKRAFRNRGAVECADHLADADDASVQRKVSDPHRFIVGVSPPIGESSTPEPQLCHAVWHYY